MSARLPACSVLILAGGRGARMGGRDKGLLEWRGEPLVAHVQRVVRPLTDDVVISCNRNQELYRGYADRLVADAEADYPGPLAGVIAGLAMARHDWVVVLGCDAPLIDRRLIEDLLGLAVGQDLPAMVRQGGIGSRCLRFCLGGCCRCCGGLGWRGNGVCSGLCWGLGGAVGWTVLWGIPGCRISILRSCLGHNLSTLDSSLGLSSKILIFI